MKAAIRAAAAAAFTGLPAVVGVMVVAGCQHTQVTDMGSGEHSLTAVAPSGGYDGSHEEGIEEANDYCHRNRQQAVIDGFFDKPELGPHGEHASSIIFKCAEPRTLKF
jgi:hypothetical protein